MLHDLNRDLQATALVCYEVREVSQGKAVPKMKQRHSVRSLEKKKQTRKIRLDFRVKFLTHKKMSIYQTPR